MELLKRNYGVLTELDLKNLTKIVYDYCGINLSTEKKIFIERKINRRINELGLNSYKEYFRFLFNEENFDKELVLLINELTTNKTDFFREPAHFDFIKDVFIKEKYKNDYKHSFKEINIWSAGCSTGEEPYTLAIVFNELKNEYINLNFNIYASDISTNVLEIAKKGIYKAETISNIPLIIKQKYFLKSKDETKKLIRVNKFIREKVIFFRENLLETRYDLPCKQDMIFCRNVLIYFDKITQTKVLTNLVRYLVTGGYLFLGHSETILGISLPIEKIAPTIYRKIG